MTNESLQRAKEIEKELDQLSLINPNDKLISIQYKRGPYYPYLPISEGFEAELKDLINTRIAKLQKELEAL